MPPGQIGIKPRPPLSFLAIFILFIPLAVFGSAGCAVWKPLPFVKVEVVPVLPETYQHYYDYPFEPGDLTAGSRPVLISEKKTTSYILRRFEIPLRLPSDLTPPDLAQLKKSVDEMSQTDQKTANDLKLQYTNRIDYYFPPDLKPGERRPVILISPILGGNMVVDHFAEYYTGRGYVAALVHRKKMRWEKEGNAKQVESYLRISVIRLREALDWILEQPEVDRGRVGAFGISYGAVLHSVLAAVEPRVKYHILAMPAAPLADVIMDCPDKAIRKLIQDAHEQNGWADDKIRVELKKEILTDPLYLAPYVSRDRVQVYIALFDRVVGAGRSFRLWRALGRPELKLIPFGHYGGILLLPYLQTSSYLAFKRHLG